MKPVWYVVALLLISLTGTAIAYTGWLVVAHPTIGANWETDGSVSFTAIDSGQPDPLGPNDRIVSANGLSVADYVTRHQVTLGEVGDTVEIVFVRAGVRHEKMFQIQRPTFGEIIDTGIAIPTALIAWLVGVVLMVQPSSAGDRKTVERLTGTFFILTAVAFSAGNLTAFTGPWLYRLYSSGFWILGALGTLVHLRFPRPYAGSRNVLVTGAIAAVGFGGALWGLLAPIDFEAAVNYLAHRAGFTWFAGNLVLWIGLLLWSWWRSPTLGERRQLGVVAVGGFLALAPFFGLLLVPRLLGLPPVPGAGLTLVSVGLLPIAYGYAILRYRRMAQDHRMARLIVYAFTTVIVVIVFFGVMAIPGVSDLPRDSMIWVAALIGGVVAGPLMRSIERWLSWILFGRWTQPLQVAGTAMRKIDLHVERQDLSSQVRAIISRQIQIHDSAVLLLDKDHRLYDPESSGRVAPAEGVRLAPGTVLMRALDDNTWVREFDEIRPALEASEEQCALLRIPWARAVLPLRFDDQLTGLILVGYRSGVTFFDPDELVVLQLMAMTAAAAFHRRQLFLDVEQQRDQASMLSQQIITVRGEERKRVARELHDDIIQPLIAHSYGLAVLDAPTAPKLRDNTLGLVEKIRLICAELREPTLDTLGLGAAVRAAVAAFQIRTQRRAELIVDQDPSAAVPDPVASAALGVLQEALANADKHAEARTIQVRVAIRTNVVNLNIRDDGRGFDVAEARKRAAQTNHFGLLGVDERVAAVGGAIRVNSLIGQGTTVDVHLPIRMQLEGSLV